MSIGERLKAERERLGLNQTDFGALGGVQKQAQLKYERGDRNPDSAYLASVSEAGVDVLYVLTGRRSVTYSAGADGQTATVTPLASESGLLTRDQVLGIVLDAMHTAGKTLPARAVFALADAAMTLQREGVPVNKSAVVAQLKAVK